MNLKKMILQFIGTENTKRILSNISYMKLLPYSLRKSDRIKVDASYVKNVQCLSRKNEHIFCGYFDLSPNNPIKDSQILVHILDKHAVAGKDPVSIAIADLDTETITELTTSQAWCWQMGSRLRWGREPGVVYYNDYEDGNYCCRKFDVEKKSIVKTIPFALYDISTDEKWGLTVNFSRLQRIRNGYGYSNLPDKTERIIAPENDGIFLVDLKNCTTKLLVSYKKLNELLPYENKGENYFNHISISPDGKNAMFFYLWNASTWPGWKATLWVVDLESGSLKCLESEDQVSHYDWVSNDSLIITGTYAGTKKGFYRYYNIHTGEKTTIEDVNMIKDGHPVVSRKNNCFYSDTYPNEKKRQRFFKYENNQYFEIAEVFHDPRMFDEKRCDLHPHYFVNRETIALDTTFWGNRRSVLILDL